MWSYSGFLAFHMFFDCIVSILTENRKKASEKWKNRAASEKRQIGFVLNLVDFEKDFVKNR